MGSGLYDFNKSIQNDAEVCVRKLEKRANSLAMALEAKYPEAGSFFKERATRTLDPACQAMSSSCRIFREPQRLLPGMLGFKQTCVKACLNAINELLILAGEIGNILYKKEGVHLDYFNKHYEATKCPFTKLLIDAFPIYNTIKTSSLNRSTPMRNRNNFFTSRRANESMAHSMFDEFDTDFDGYITRAEWQGSDAVFDALDLDGDGMLSPQEIEIGLGAGHGFGISKTASNHMAEMAYNEGFLDGQMMASRMAECDRKGYGDGDTKCYTPKGGGNGKPGQGTHMYGLYNEYGEANSGENGSKERAEYNKKYYSQSEGWGEGEGKIKRTTCPPGAPCGGNK